MFPPITSVAFERSFSRYKNLLSDNTCPTLEKLKNIREHLITEYISDILPAIKVSITILIKTYIYQLCYSSNGIKKFKISYHTHL